MPYVITKVDAKIFPVLFELATAGGKHLHGKVYRQQIIPVPPDYHSQPFKIEYTIGKEITDRKTGRKKIKCKFLDYPLSYAAYIYVDTIIKGK